MDKRKVNLKKLQLQHSSNGNKNSNIVIPQKISEFFHKNNSQEEHNKASAEEQFTLSPKIKKNSQKFESTSDKIAKICRKKSELISKRNTPITEFLEKKIDDSINCFERPKKSKPIKNPNNINARKNNSTKLKGKSKQLNLKKLSNRKEHEEELFARLTAQQSLSENLDPDELQMTIALSRSIVDSFNVCDSNNFDGVYKTEENKFGDNQQTLEKFGFNSTASLNLKKILNTKPNRKKLKYISKATLDYLRKSEQERIEMAILNEIQCNQFIGNGKYEVQSYYLKDMHDSNNRNFYLQSSDDESSLMLDAYYINGLVQKANVNRGCLLKNWSEIPGRDLTPPRINSINYFEIEINDIQDENDTKLFSDTEMQQCHSNSPDLFSSFEEEEGITDSFEKHAVEESVPNRSNVVPLLFSEEFKNELQNNFQFDVLATNYLQEELAQIEKLSQNKQNQNYMDENTENCFKLLFSNTHGTENKLNITHPSDKLTNLELDHRTEEGEISNKSTQSTIIEISDDEAPNYVTRNVRYKKQPKNGYFKNSMENHSSRHDVHLSNKHLSIPFFERNNENVHLDKISMAVSDDEKTNDYNDKCISSNSSVSISDDEVDYSIKKSHFLKYSANLAFSVEKLEKVCKKDANINSNKETEFKTKNTNFKDLSDVELIYPSHAENHSNEEPYKTHTSKCTGLKFIDLLLEDENHLGQSLKKGDLNSHISSSKCSSLNNRSIDIFSDDISLNISSTSNDSKNLSLSNNYINDHCNFNQPICEHHHLSQSPENILYRKENVQYQNNTQENTNIIPSIKPSYIILNTANKPDTVLLYDSSNDIDPDVFLNTEGLNLVPENCSNIITQEDSTLSSDSTLSHHDNVLQINISQREKQLSDNGSDISYQSFCSIINDEDLTNVNKKKNEYDINKSAIKAYPSGHNFYEYLINSRSINSITKSNRTGFYTNNLIDDEFDYSPIASSIPNYHLMSLKELHQELEKIGVKKLNRNKAILVLKHIYIETHPLIEDMLNKITKDGKFLSEATEIKNKTFSIQKTNQLSSNKQILIGTYSGIDFSEVDSGEDMFKIDKFTSNLLKDDEIFLQTKPRSNKIHYCAVPLHISFYNLFRSNSKLRRAVLSYQPLELDRLYFYFKSIGLKYELNVS